MISDVLGKRKAEDKDSSKDKGNLKSNNNKSNKGNAKKSKGGGGK